MKHELLITLDRQRAIPLNRQIFEQIRSAICSGGLRWGDPLPATRALAEQLCVSRTVILQSYELLQSEGYLEMRRGAGTFVAQLSAEHPEFSSETAMIEGEGLQSSCLVAKVPELSVFSPPLSSQSGSPNTVICDFRHGVPAWDAFPMDSWQKALMNACRRATPDTLGYGPAEGSLRLRREIARLLRSTRSIPVSAEQIVITSGATQALDILARLCVSEGDRVIMEDPSHPTICEIFKFSGAEIISVPVDDEGICVEKMGRAMSSTDKNGQNAAPKLIYVTPSHQFPLGTTMSLNRRIQLLQWAKGNGAIIIEDDYDSEYRYIGPKLSALTGLDSSSRVIYIGSFSKILFPALRIGFIILPPSMIPAFLAVKWLTDRMSPALEQEALAEFIQSGRYARHVAQMNKLYAQRRSFLLQSLKKEFGERIRLFGEEAGLHVLVELDSMADEASIADAALQYGVRVYPAASYFVNAKPRRPVFLLGYANLSEAQMEIGVKGLASAEAEVAGKKQASYRYTSNAVN